MIYYNTVSTTKIIDIIINTIIDSVYGFQHEFDRLTLVDRISVYFYVNTKHNAVIKQQ